MGASCLVGALITIVTGGGRFGNWLRSTLNRPLDDKLEQTSSDVHRFMDDHSDCKAKTEESINRIDGQLDNVQKILERDLKDKNRHEADVRRIFRILDTLLDHSIHGNNIDSLRKEKDELHSYVFFDRE